MQTVDVTSCACAFLSSAPPVVVSVPFGGLWLVAPALSPTVTRPRDLHRPSDVTCAPVLPGKSKSGVRSELYQDEFIL